MIQLRRIRTYAPKGLEPKSVEKPTDPPQEFENIHKLFRSIPQAIEKLPTDERWNIFYTLGHTDGDYHRNWAGQDVIPFDIDGVAGDDGSFDVPAYLDAIYSVLEVDRGKCITVASGNGIQILVQPSQRIESKDFFRLFRSPYERLCEEIAQELDRRGLPYKEVDPSSFAINRIFRLPGTENRKADRPSREARLLGGVELSPQPFHITPLATGPAAATDPRAVPPKEHVPADQMKFFAIDTPAVESGCGFLRWAKASPADLNEPQWYALLSIVGRLDDGRQKAHAYGQDHPSYSERDTDRKLDQALAASGPRTCENIQALWGECAGCPHFHKVTSPISIKSESFVASEKGGFYLVGKSGALSPQYEDLRRFFHREHAYKTHSKSGIVYVFDGKKYATWTDTELRSYAHDHFDPKPAEHVASEFVSWINRTNLIESEWFKLSTRGHINFDNGILCVSSGELKAHSPEHGFQYVLPFAYNPAAASPIFDRFMEEISCGDHQLVQLMLEFVGYSLCDRDYWLQKALLLIGEGSNGKSTFLQVVKELAGENNTSCLALYDLQSETSRSQLEGKLLNISDELPSYNFKSTETMKKLMGGAMTTRKLYHDGMMIENTTKFIFAGNSIPSTDDVSDGFLRRLAIVPFKAKFNLGPEQADSKAADTTLLSRIKDELPGVFNTVLKHYQALKTRGYLVEALAAKAEHQRYREEVDRTGSWIKENLYWNGSWGHDKPFTMLNAIFERYVSDCKRSEEKPLPKFHMTKHLRRHIDCFDKRYDRPRINGERPYILRGVEFRKEIPKEHF